MSHIHLINAIKILDRAFCIRVTYLTWLCTFLVILLCASCLPSKQPPLKIDYYTLDYEAPQPLKDTAKLPVIIMVSRFSSSPEYRTDKIIYQEKRSTLSTYTYHRWRAAPADLVTYYLARDLQSIGSFKAVSSPSGRITPTHRVEGTIDKFLEVDTKDYWQAVIAVTITLIDTTEPDVSKQVLFQESFTQKSRCDSQNPLSVSKAMAVAMASISSQVNSAIVEKLQ